METSSVPWWNLQQQSFLASSLKHGKIDAFLIFVDFWFCAKLRWASWPDRSKCVLFQKLPGMTAVAASYDWMHAKLLGTDMVFHGSCLWLLCYEILPEAPLQNLQTCWQKILSVYKEKQIVERYRGMNKLSLFKRKSGGPKLKGRAAQVAATAEPMLSLWEEHMDDALQQHKQVRTWLKLNVAVEKLIKQNEDELAFSPADHSSLKKMCFGMAQLHSNSLQPFLNCMHFCIARWLLLIFPLA